MSKFNDLINGETPILVDFYAEWCGPCKTMSPILQSVKKELGDKVKIIKIDVDKNPTVSQKFQVRGVPTLILFKNGNTLWRQSGVLQAQELVYIIEENIN